MSNSEIGTRVGSLETAVGSHSDPAAYERILAEFVPEIICVADSTGNAAYYNKYWYEYSGLTCQQTIEDGWSSVLHPEDREQALAIWRKALSTGTPYTTEYRIRRASDGMYRWHLVKGSPVTKAGGSVINWLLVAVDFHEAKLASLAAEKDNARLRKIASPTANQDSLVSCPRNK